MDQYAFLQDKFIPGEKYHFKKTGTINTFLRREGDTFIFKHQEGHEFGMHGCNDNLHYAKSV